MSINLILNNLNKAKELINKLQNIEKNKIIIIKNEANDLFHIGYKELENFEYNVNSIEYKSLEHSELIITAAETAFLTENYQISRNIIENYLIKLPQQDQFYCRAKIVLGLLIDYEANSTYGEHSIKQRKLALNELIIALQIALLPDNKERYQFIIFNISLDCWKIVRQFLRKGRAKYFKDEMLLISQALENLKNIDKNWLINFYTGTSFCFDDSEESKKSQELLDKAIILAEEIVQEFTHNETSKFDQITNLSKKIEDLQKQLHTSQEMEEKIKQQQQQSSTELQENNNLITYDGPSSIELVTKLHIFQKQLANVKDEYKTSLETKLPLQDRVMKLYFQKIYSSPNDGKKLLTLPQISQSIRMKLLTTIHLMYSGSITPNEYDNTFKNMLNELDNISSNSNTSPNLIPLLAETYFDISRSSRNLGGRKDGGFLREISNKSFNKGKELIRTHNILSPILLVKQDLCTAVMMADNCQNYSQLFESLKNSDGFNNINGNNNDLNIHENNNNNNNNNLSNIVLSEKQMEGYSLNNRLETIKLLERILSVSQNRIKEDFLIQEICVEVWNVLYPLIQNHLRKHIHRTLQLLSAALTDIDSPLYRLRTQISYELSKCEEFNDFVVKAYQEGLNALDLDYGDINNFSSDFVKNMGGESNSPRGKTVSPRSGNNKNNSNSNSNSTPTTTTTTTIITSSSQNTTNLTPIISRIDNPSYDSDRKYDVLITPYVDILNLRASVYNSPESLEDQVILSLQQIRESSSKRYKKDLLSKSSQTMFEILKNQERNNDIYMKLNDYEREYYLTLRDELLEKQEFNLRNKTLNSNNLTTIKSNSVGSMIIPLEMIEIVLEKFLRTKQITEEVKVDTKSNSSSNNPANNLNTTTINNNNNNNNETELTKVLQKRIYIMSMIAEFGHVSQSEIYKNSNSSYGYVSRKDSEYRVELSYIVEKSLLYILTHTWKPKDFMVRKLVIGQIDALCKLSESLINRLDSFHIQDSELMIIIPHNGPLPVKQMISFEDIQNPSEDENLPLNTVFIDPRAMGILGKISGTTSNNSNNNGNNNNNNNTKHSYSAEENEITLDDRKMNQKTQEMLLIKRIIVKLLIQALILATNSADVVAVQNVLIYFWNIHIHIFKYNLYHLMIPECIEFLEIALKSFDTIIQSAQSFYLTCGKSGLDKINFPTIDYKLQAQIIEVLMLSYVSKGNIQGAIEIGIKSCNTYKLASIYSRRRLCELVSRLVLLTSSIPNVITSIISSSSVNSNTTTSGGGNNNNNNNNNNNSTPSSSSSSSTTKGGKKGNNTTNSTSSDVSSSLGLSQFDNPILNVISMLVTIELYSSSVFLSLVDDQIKYQTQIPILIEKCTNLMKNDVTTVINNLNNRVNDIGESIPLSQEENDEIQEILVSCWARLTRGNLKLRNIYATNDTANECMQIVHKGITPNNNNNNNNNLELSSIDGGDNNNNIHGIESSSKYKLNKRVWRWASLCSRYMGLAISYLIQDEGQEKQLQNELRLASLRHLTISCQFGENSENNDLILYPAIDAWNIFLPMIDEICQPKKQNSIKKLIQSLIHLQRTILKSLLSYKININQDNNSDDNNQNDKNKNNNGNNNGDNDNNGILSENDPEELINIVKLNYYLAIIEELAQQHDWKTALEIVMESFENVPIKYHKPLWKWRVIVMSKRGKNVLDGLQKLKENDVILQARVYAILARNSSKQQQQLESYLKAIDILKNDLGRVEYLLEIAQWISSSGLSTIIASEMIQSALDSLYEIEENCLIDEIETNNDGTVSESSRSTRTTKTANRMLSAQSSTRSMSRRGSAMMLRSRQGSKQSLRSEKLNSLINTPKLNIKQLDQAIRGISMLCILEVNTELKCEKALESIFFIERALLCWQNAIDQIIGDITIIIDNKNILTNTIDENLYKIPTDSIDLLLWNPSKEFILLTIKCQELIPLFVPSSQSIMSIQLTFYYLLYISNILDTNSYNKSVSLCLAWLKLCIMFNTNLLQSDILLVILYYKTFLLLSKLHLLKRQLIYDDNSSNNNNNNNNNAINLNKNDLLKSLPNIILSDQIGLLNKIKVSQIVSQIGYLDPSIHHNLQSQDNNINDEVSFTTERSIISEEKSIKDTKRRNNQMLSTSTSTGINPNTTRFNTTRSSQTINITPLNTVLTYTIEYTTNIDLLSYYLQLCELLLQIGHINRVKKIASYVYNDCNLNINHRLKINAGLVLSEVYYLLGNYSEAIYLIQSNSIDFNESSDPKLLVKQLKLLVLCYQRMKNLTMASSIMLNTIQIFNQIVNNYIKNITINGNSNTNSHTSLKNDPSTNTFSSDQTNQRKNSSIVINDQLPFDLLESYINLIINYMETIILNEILLNIKSKTFNSNRLSTISKTNGLETSLNSNYNKNLSNITTEFIDFSSLINIYNNTINILEKTNNHRSLLYSLLNASYAKCIFTIIKIQYCDYCKSIPHIDFDNYLLWIESNLNHVVNLYEESVGIINGLQNKIPLSEILYFPSTKLNQNNLQLSNNNNNNNNNTTSGRSSFLQQQQQQQGLGLGDDNEKDNEIPKKIILSNTLNIEFIRLQNELLSIMLFYHLFKNQNTEAPAQLVNLDDLNPVEKYLEEHRPSTATTKTQLFDLNSLTPSLIDKCVLLSSSISQLSSNTNEELIEKYVSYFSSLIAQKIEVGELESTLSIQWLKKVQSDVIENSEVIESNLKRRQDDIQTLQLLETYLLQLLSSISSLFYYNQLLLGSYYLLEGSGKYSPSSTAFYLMNYQNIVTREWLYQLWKSCLSSTSEIYQSLCRIEKLNEQKVPLSSRSIERLQLEYEFLKVSSLVWNRLSITNSIKDILTSPIINQHTCIISIQLCPMKRTLYACAGYPKVLQTNHQQQQQRSDYSSSEDLPGSWYVNKIFFDETQRRSLQILSSQYTSWIESTSKFLTTYGEGLVESMDYEDYLKLNEPHFHLTESIRNMMKAEHAIEEEFRSLLDAFSSLLNPLIGIGSEIDHFIESIQHHNQSSTINTTAPPMISKSSSTVSNATSMNSILSQSPQVILLLGDELLQLLPFEALPIIQTRFHGNIVRDFSINLLGNRLKSSPSLETVDRITIQPSNIISVIDPYYDDPIKLSNNNSNNDNPSVQPSKSESIDKQAIDFANSNSNNNNNYNNNSNNNNNSKGNSKVTSSQAVPVTTSQSSTTTTTTANNNNNNNNLHYIGERLTITEVVSKLQHLQNGVVGGSKWINLIPPEKKGSGMSLQDWITLSSIRDNSITYEKSLFLYTPGRVLGTLISPKEICNLNLRNIGLLVTSDLTQTDLSFRRQLTIDSRKQSDDLLLETPLTSIALYSLTGVGCIITNLWSTTLTSLEKQTTTFWREFSKGNTSIVQSINRGKSIEVDLTTLKLIHENGFNSTSHNNNNNNNNNIEHHETKKSLRKWLKYSRIIVGIPSIYYALPDGK